MRGSKSPNRTGPKLERATVRPAADSDLGRIAKLMAVFTGREPSRREIKNRFALITKHPDQTLWVATVDESVVGLLGFRIRHNLESVSQYGEVSILVVDQDWRRKGIGRLLLDHAEKLSRKNRCVGLWLVSGFGREQEAHRFYDRAGFSRTGIRFVKPLASET
jgi:GNAT superfamily N-acetyltransferase